MIVTSALISPKGSMMLNSILSNFVYLSLLGGPYLTYPTIVIEQSTSIGISPVDLPNLYSRLADSGACMPPDTFVKAKMDCNIFSNMQVDLPPMTVILLANLTISLLYLLVKTVVRRSSKAEKGGVVETVGGGQKEEGKQANSREQQDWDSSSRLVQVSWWMNYNYGIRFFVLYARSMMMEIVNFAFINIISFDSSESMIIGTFTSLGLLAYFGLVSLLVFRCCKFILDKRRSYQSTSKAIAGEAISKDIRMRMIDIKESKFYYVDFYFEGMATDRPIASLLFVTSDLARSLAIAILVYCLADYPFV